MNCQRCKSERVLRVRVSHSDRGHFYLGNESHIGYAPDISNICNNDDTFPDICMNCGQTQGDFPKDAPKQLVARSKCDCSDEDRSTHDDGDGEYCTNCGNDVRKT